MNITVDQFKDAAWARNFDLVKEYVEGGGDVNACASNGVSALVTFDTDILEYLFQHGADASAVWADGNPAICFHAWEVSIESLQWFLEKGVDPNLAHRDTGENSLHSLTAKPYELEKRLEAIKLLFQFGANPNTRTNVGALTGNFMRDVRVVGETALHRAAAYQSKDTIEFLLRQGADKTLKDARGESPLSWASRHWRDREILKLLEYGTYQVPTAVSVRSSEFFVAIAGGRYFGVPADEVAGVGEWTEPAPLPRAPKSVLGVVSYRGRMLTVIDPTEILESDDQRTTGSFGCFIALKGDEQLAISAEKAIEKIPVDLDEIQQPSSHTPNAVAGFIDSNGKRLAILDTSKLFEWAAQGGERRRRRT